MKRKVLLCLICMCLVAPASLSAEKMTGNWHLTGYTKYRDAIFADTARLSSHAPDATAVWIKIAPSPRSKYLTFINDYLESVSKHDRGFKSIEILCEINCSRHLIRFTRFVYLDNHRNIIHDASETDMTWLQINRGGIWYPVEKEACKDQ